MAVKKIDRDRLSGTSGLAAQGSRYAASLAFEKAQAGMWALCFSCSSSPLASSLPYHTSLPRQASLERLVLPNSQELYRTREASARDEGDQRASAWSTTIIFSMVVGACVHSSRHSLFAISQSLQMLSAYLRLLYFILL